MKRIAIIMTIMLLAAGCNRETGTETPLTETSDISLTWKGARQVTYSPDNCQMAYNDARHEYRVYDDKLANWFILRCSEAPVSVGQLISADVSWTGKSSTKEFIALEFSVEKTDENGQIWLYNPSNKIGIVIKNI